MSRNVAFLWRRTIANVKGFPPYYPGTHELQWVDLLFGVKRCFVCRSSPHASCNIIVICRAARARTVSLLSGSCERAIASDACTHVESMHCPVSMKLL